MDSIFFQKDIIKRSLKERIQKIQNMDGHPTTL